MPGKNKVQRLFYLFDLIKREFDSIELPKKKFILILKAHIGSDKRTIRDYLTIINEFDFIIEDKEKNTVKVNMKNVDQYRRFSRTNE